MVQSSGIMEHTCVMQGERKGHSRAGAQFPCLQCEKGNKFGWDKEINRGYADVRGRKTSFCCRKTSEHWDFNAKMLKSLAKQGFSDKLRQAR